MREEPYYLDQSYGATGDIYTIWLIVAAIAYFAWWWANAANQGQKRTVKGFFGSLFGLGIIVIPAIALVAGFIKWLFG